MHTPVLIELDKGYLAGSFYQPTECTIPWRAVFFCHGYTGNRIETRRLFVRFARFLNDNGIAAFTFDYRGHGESSGRFEHFTVKDWIKDAQIAFDYFLKKTEIVHDKIAVLGYSLGGCIASFIAEKPFIEKVLLWAPVASPEDMFNKKHLKMTNEQKFDLASKHYFDSGGYIISQNFIDNLKNIDPVAALSKTKAAQTLIIHAEDDEVVDINENSQRYFDALSAVKKDVQLLKAPDGGHGFSNLESEKFLLTKSLDFLKRAE